MRIGIVCFPSVGGSGILATELGHELALRGHEIHFITYEIPFRLNLESPNIHFHEVEMDNYELFRYPDYALTLAVKISHVVKQYNLDILHVHYALPHATSAFLAKQILGNHPVKVITTLHGTDITLVGKVPNYCEIIKFSIMQSDGVTAVSNSLKQQTLEHFKIDIPIEVIYNFFIPHPDMIGKKPLHDTYVNPGEKLLVHSSNYRSVKRPEDVVRIFLQVRKKVPCKLLLIGSGMGIDNVKEMIEEQKLANEVFLVGKSRQVDAYIASGDVFLLPSSQESFGLAALEAMAYGVPVVASDVGGLPELIIQNKTGFLAAMGNIEMMAEYAIEILTNKELHDQFCEASKKRAQEHFSVEKIVPEYEAYYERMLKT